MKKGKRGGKSSAETEMRDKRHVSLGRGKIEIYCKIKFLTINEISRCKIDDPHTLLIPHFALRLSSAPAHLHHFHFPCEKCFMFAPDPCYFSVFQTLLSRRATIDCFFAVASNLRYFLSLLCLCLSLFPDLFFVKFNFQSAFSAVVFSW